MHGFILTVLAMLAFAGSSLLCRVALKHTGIDPTSFASIRIIAGALVLVAIVRLRAGTWSMSGSWPAALTLVAYAVTFSAAYVSLAAANGELMLFGAVQATMITYGLWRGERLNARQAAGFALALAGLAGLMLPGLSAPPLIGGMLMLAAGIAWGAYGARKRATAAGARMPFTSAMALASRWRSELEFVMVGSIRVGGKCRRCQ